MVQAWAHLPLRWKCDCLLKLYLTTVSCISSRVLDRPSISEAILHNRNRQGTTHILKLACSCNWLNQGGFPVEVNLQTKLVRQCHTLYKECFSERISIPELNKFQLLATHLYTYTYSGTQRVNKLVY